MEKEKSNKNLRVTGTIKRRRSALVIMGSLIGLVNPLLHIMLAAIALGTLGYLCAIFLTILAGQVIIHGLMNPAADIAISAKSVWLSSIPIKTIIIIMLRSFGEFCIMQSSTATILLLSNCWRLSDIKYLQLSENSVRRSWKERIKAI